MVDSVDNLIRKYALVNAIEHEGIAQTKSILGKILAEQPELRAQIFTLRTRIEDIVREVNNLGVAKQKNELDKIGGYVAPVRVERKGLPELERGREKFVVRFAPNPDGAIHIGNARPAILSDEYAKKYNGKFILRFDDTDPKIKTAEKKFYKWIRDDLKWLKIKVSQELVASSRLKIYYSIAEKVISLGNAYVCTCESDHWKKLRDHSKACPCRNEDSKTVMKKWKKMLKHQYKEGQAVLRIKTEMDAKNPAVRDWPAFRTVDKPNHPLQRKAKVWPLYNFASGVDDHLTGVTHIFRGQEHSTNEVKQRYMYQHLKWNYPVVVTLGRFSLSDMVLSKSQIREGIEKHKFRDWDDVRLGTIRALRRRGFQPESIRQIIVDIGPKPSDVTISFENLSAYNRKIIDNMANRYFFIPNPKKIEIKGMKIKHVNVPLHPDDKKRGYRSFSLTNTFFIDADDFAASKGVEVRLKDLCNIKLGDRSEYTGIEVKPTPKIQWVPAKHCIVRVIMAGKEIKGYGEINLLKTKPGDIVQFERFGFVRIEKIQGKNVVVVFGHK
ncbi:MAG: glutamate--tRNA ligase [Candidatus Aenigmarchaeota archaeon]|nr:glutamate--tRNA ligase [Candidatus Aenigmarchaeota archaeon]